MVTICSSVNRVFFMAPSVVRGRHSLKLQLVRNSPGRSGERDWIDGERLKWRGDATGDRFLPSANREMHLVLVDARRQDSVDERVHNVSDRTRYLVCSRRIRPK